ncbi:SRPBCC domain-containing protein [Fluviicola sp.]|uniref:SRPBCC domain-containing protein n=1 Tax=Fluviicola sp. TaxID=1917219 RepID=UPI0031D7E6F7
MQELQTTATFTAPLVLIWEAWTDPEKIVNWWGPAGFSTTIHQMDFREEGEWKLTLHGPDGTNYPNRSIYREIVPLKKIVFEHFNPHFITTVLFESVENGTELQWNMLFDSEEQFNTIVKAHKADEGQKQNIERLNTYIQQLIEEGKFHD